MSIIRMLLISVAALPACLCAGEPADSLTYDCSGELDEVVVLGTSPALRHESDRIVYQVKNDPYAKGLDALNLLGRMPRVSLVDDRVNIAGKTSVRYIIDGHLLEMTDEAVTLRLKSLQASSIEKIELLVTPPPRYAASAGVAYVSITTRDETLGTRGNLWASSSAGKRWRSLIGGDISHTTRKIGISADVSWQDMNGLNDLERTYIFLDGDTRLSSRRTRFSDRRLGANAMFTYKFREFLRAGTVANFSSGRLASDLADTTAYGDALFLSTCHSPSRPDNALTLTAFADWTLDSSGKTISLTYNFFDRHTRSFSDVTTASPDMSTTRLADSGRNRYLIHSAKLDASLPFPHFKLEAGGAFTAVSNSSRLCVSDFRDNVWVDNPLQSNTFDYTENTAAVYLGIQRDFSSALFARLSLRYEHTHLRGVRPSAHENACKDYGYLFPSLSVSWNTARAGRVSLSYNMGITRPDFRDLNPFRYYTTATDWFSGNPDLAPSLSHNAELNYSYKGLYAVLYNSYTCQAIAPVTRFTTSGAQYTMPMNGLDTDKSGLYASWTRNLFSWWNIKAGGEICHTYAKARTDDFRDRYDHAWSGKLELRTSWMLNPQKTLVLSVNLNHRFPFRERMTHYSSLTLLGCDIRWSLLRDRLNLSLSLNDPFGWNIVRSRIRYADCTLRARNDIHARALTLRVSWTLGRDKVSRIHRDTKERESRRTHP